jgi:hypothetical protein
MDIKELQNELDRIREEIATLPIGYISQKTIYGKTRYYHQWTENGKKKSKYIDNSIVEELQAKIERRKELQKREKELSMLVNVPTVQQTKAKSEPAYKTKVILGKELKSHIATAAKYKRRSIYKQITDFIYSNIYDKVFILYGLRRTGKSTLIRQVIADMSQADFDKTAYIQISRNDDLAKLNKDLQVLEQNGFKYVFIDEVTLMSDFIEGAALLSDIYAAMGVKIVLSGTDSLGFIFSKSDQLYDRCFLAHTTFIPYREFEEVLGVKGIDEYICYGGTMSLGGVHYNETSTFANKKSTDEYVDSAIARNIQHSLKCYQYEGHFRHLYDLYKNNELTGAINRVIEDVNHQFTMEVLTRDFISHDLGISAKNLRNDRHNPNDILDRINKEEFTERLKNLLEIKNKSEQGVTLTDIHRKEIREYLDLLDLTYDIPIHTIPVSNDIAKRTVFTQPGMRYAQAKNLVQSLLYDETFQSIAAADRAEITERILDEIKGRMMEDIVLLETKMANAEREVFKLQFAVGEFDMVVADNQSLTVQVYEIKHSDKIVKEQYRHLIDKEKLAETEFRYGKIIKRAVIYRGENTTTDDGIDYINVEDYLKSL